MNRYITSLDAFWQTDHFPSDTRVDLLARYPGVKLATEGKIELLDPNPLVIIRDAIFCGDRWFYRNIEGIDVLVPEVCQVKAWRPTLVRTEAYERADDIDRMLALLLNTNAYDPRDRHALFYFCQILRRRLHLEEMMLLRSQVQTLQMEDHTADITMLAMFHTTQADHRRVVH